MPRQPRFVPAHSLQHIVDTTFQNRCLLRPSKALNRRFLGILGRAQRKYAMRVCAVVVASTHHHLLLQPKDAAHLASFMCFLKTNLSKELGTRQRGWQSPFFAHRYHVTSVSDEESAQVRVLRYILAHGPKENLVDHARQWPGVHSAQALIEGTAMVGSWRNTRNSKPSTDEDTESVEHVHLSPLPCWQHLPEATWRPWVRDLVDDIDREAAAGRVVSGKRSLGVTKILAVNPIERRNPPQASPQPRFHASDPGVLKSMIEVWQTVITAFHQASAELRGGNRRAQFPEGTFPPALPFVPFTPPHVPSTRGQPA